jgi:hypothetical protein
MVDEESGESCYEQESLQPDAFKTEMELMSKVAVVLDRVYIQLIHRYLRDGA